MTAIWVITTPTVTLHLSEKLKYISILFSCLNALSCVNSARSQTNTRATHMSADLLDLFCSSPHLPACVCCREGSCSRKYSVCFKCWRSARTHGRTRRAWTRGESTSALISFHATSGAHAQSITAYNQFNYFNHEFNDHFFLLYLKIPTVFKTLYYTDQSNKS